MGSSRFETGKVAETGRNSTITSFFTVVNGVRQGGIMSPIIFNIYMDELSCELNGVI